MWIFASFQFVFYNCVCTVNCWQFITQNCAICFDAYQILSIRLCNCAFCKHYYTQVLIIQVNIGLKVIACILFVLFDLCFTCCPFYRGPWSLSIGALILLSLWCRFWRFWLVLNLLLFGSVLEYYNIVWFQVGLCKNYWLLLIWNLIGSVFSSGLYLSLAVCRQ